MFDLRSFRIYHQVSQAQITELLGSNQATVSKMERFIFDLSPDQLEKLKGKYGEVIDQFIIDGPYLSDILKTFDWRSIGDPGYETIKNEIIGYLDSIKNYAGKSTEEVSKSLFRNKKTLHRFLTGGALHPSLATIVAKHYRKYVPSPSTKILDNIDFSSNPVELTPEQLAVLMSEEAKLAKGKLYMSPKELIKFEPGKSEILTEYIGPSISYVVVDSNNLAPYIKFNDIIGIESVPVINITPGAYYLIIFSTGKYSYDYIQIGSKPNLWSLCNAKGSIPYIEVDEEQIIQIFKIVLTIRREE